MRADWMNRLNHLTALAFHFGNRILNSSIDIEIEENAAVGGYFIGLWNETTSIAIFVSKDAKVEISKLFSINFHVKNSRIEDCCTIEV